MINNYSINKSKTSLFYLKWLFQNKKYINRKKD